MRLHRAVLVVVVCLSLAVSSRAVEIQVEGPQDSLAQPPQDLTMNHCTLSGAAMVTDASNSS